MIAECPKCHEVFEADKPSGAGGIFCPMCPGPMKGVLHFREPRKALDLLDAFEAQHEKHETEIYNLRRALSVLGYDSQAIATGLYDLERDGFIDYRQRATAAEAKIAAVSALVEADPRILSPYSIAKIKSALDAPQHTSRQAFYPSPDSRVDDELSEKVAKDLFPTQHTEPKCNHRWSNCRPACPGWEDAT